MIRFDAYSATMTGQKSHVLTQILIDQAGADLTFHQGRGHHSFGERLAVKDSTGSEIGSVQWGGAHGERMMFEVKGQYSPGAVEALRCLCHHRVTRVDACADFDAPSAFESLLGPCIEVKQKHNLKGEKRGDWEDFPELGRTQYIGAPTSPVRVRLYEKGKQPEYRHMDRPNWTRIEVQARPAKDAKSAFSHVSPADVWGASTWSRELAGMVLQEHIDPHPAGTTYRLSERDKALAWMCKQYGKHLVSLAADLGGWECLGLTLKEILNESKT